jgi:hypothetical protein
VKLVDLSNFIGQYYPHAMQYLRHKLNLLTNKIILLAELPDKVIEDSVCGGGITVEQDTENRERTYHSVLKRRCDTRDRLSSVASNIIMNK